MNQYAKSILERLEQEEDGLPEKSPTAKRMSFQSPSSTSEPFVQSNATLTNLLSFEAAFEEPHSPSHSGSPTLTPLVQTDEKKHEAYIANADDAAMLHQQLLQLKKANQKLRAENQSLRTTQPISPESVDVDSLDDATKYLEMKNQHNNSLILIRALQDFKVNLETKNIALEKETSQLRLQEKLQERREEEMNASSEDVAAVKALMEENAAMKIKISSLQRSVISANEQVKEANQHCEELKTQMDLQNLHFTHERNIYEERLSQSHPVSDDLSEPQATSDSNSGGANQYTDNSAISPWYTMSKSLQYNVFDQEVGDLEYTKALVRPIMQQAPISVFQAEKLLYEHADELHQELMSEIGSVLDTMNPNKAVDQRQWNASTHIISTRKQWTNGLLKDLSATIFLRSGESTSKDIIGHAEKHLRNQQSIVVSKIVEAFQEHFGDSKITAKAVGRFTKDVLSDVQEHNMETISVQIPRTITAMEQTKLLRLSCVFDDSLALSRLLTSENEDAKPRPFMDDNDSNHCVQCGMDFKVFTRRRHHCRLCGILVCNRCSGKRCQILKFHIRAAVRVCDRCFIILRVMDDSTK